MKLNSTYLLFLALLSIGFVSCNDDDDDDKIDSPIVGAWTRDIYVMAEAPANFDSWNGTPFSSLFLGEESYELTFNDDGTFTRKISIAGSSDINDQGDWLLEDDDLTIESTEDDINDALGTDYTVEDEITNELLISQFQNLRLLPNTVVDTLEEAELADDDLMDQLFDDYSEVVSVKVLYIFEK